MSDPNPPSRPADDAMPDDASPAEALAGPDGPDGLDDLDGLDGVEDLGPDEDAEAEAAAAVARRRARRRRGRRGEPFPPDPRGPVIAVVAVGIVAGVVALASLVPPADPGTLPPATVRPVDTSSAVCLEPGSAPGATTTNAIAVVPGLEGQDRPGSAALGFVGSAEPVAIDADSSSGALDAAGVSGQVILEDEESPPLLVATEGGLAPGLVAAQYTEGVTGLVRGLASLPCLAPRTSWWFVGGGSTAGRSSSLVLVNPEASDAEVDVVLAGKDGPISAPSVRGIVVPAASRTVIALAEIAPRESFVTWQVTVRAGRVVAGVYDAAAEGFVPEGVEWIPASTDPSTRVIVPGVSGGDGPRQLLLHAPGEVDTEVAVRILAKDGAFTPADLTSIEVPAGTVVAVDLAAVLEGIPATLDLRSDVPIVAGVRQTFPGIAADIEPLDEVSFAAGAPRIASITAATALPAARGTAVRIWIAAPGRGVAPAAGAEVLPDYGADTGAAASSTEDSSVLVRIRILPFPATAGAPPEPIEVEVPRDRTVVVDIPRPDGATWYTAVVEPQGAPIYVAHLATYRGQRGILFTGFPWVPLRTTVSVPTVTERLDVAEPVSD